MFCICIVCDGLGVGFGCLGSCLEGLHYSTVVHSAFILERQYSSGFIASFAQLEAKCAWSTQDFSTDTTQQLEPKQPVVAGAVEDVKSSVYTSTWCLIAAQANWHLLQFTHDFLRHIADPLYFVFKVLPIAVQLWESLHHTMVNDVYHAARVHIGPVDGGVWRMG